MKNMVRQYIRQCEVCQRSKYENLHPVGGASAAIAIPYQAWEEMSMDFIEGLPKSGCKTTILVVASQICTFLFCFPSLHSQWQLPSLIVCSNYMACPKSLCLTGMYGKPRIIVSDRDGLFTNKFWENSGLYKVQDWTSTPPSPDRSCKYVPWNLFEAPLFPQASRVD